MTKIGTLLIGAVIALSASAAAAAPAKSVSSCYDAYGRYGYSAAYCAHDPYGRSSPADRFFGQDRASPWLDSQDSPRVADRELDSYSSRGYAVPSRDDSAHYPDRDPNRDRG
jgi:hypothetical protein